jgi:2-C-methyl-D-erythritol 4-phosphate cytidylyltransferase
VPEAVWTIVVAAGAARRFGRAKQFEDLGGRRVVDWAVDAAASLSNGIVVVLPPGDPVGWPAQPGVLTVTGGATRSESVRRGLEAVPADAGVVCVHDAARPFATPALFAAVVAAVRAGAAGAVPGTPVTDTVKVVDAEGVVLATPERSTLVAVQTPQAFRADVLRRAHAAGGEGTDDATLVEALGARVLVVPGEARNRKLTNPEDLDWARTQVDAGAVR